MRILPVALRFATESVPNLLDRVGRSSAITHGHPRCRMACGYYALVAKQLLAGIQPSQAYEAGRSAFLDAFSRETELNHFHGISQDLSIKPEDWVVSTGYVVHTLAASLWCLLTSNNYRECVLKAVNLGGDTDTTGCVAGGLAGVAYGINAIPSEWIQQLARRQELEQLFHSFSEVCESDI